MNAQVAHQQECKTMKDLRFAKLEDRVEPRTTPKESFLELDALPGTWLNTSNDSGGIGKVIITSQNSKLKLRVFEAAGPDFRDWGEVEAEHIYASSIASQVAAGFTAWYHLDHADIHLQANWNQGLLVLASFTSFKDGRKHSNCFAREFFHRQ
jgi:hypothetical protein